MDIDTELLISAVEEKNNIWDVSDENYKNRDAREKSWEDIAAAIIPNFVGLDNKEKKTAVAKLQKRWKTVRDAFTRCRAKGKTLKSGSAAKKGAKYIYYENLRFLEKTMELNSTEANFTEATQQSDDQNSNQDADDHSDKEIDEKEFQAERLQPLFDKKRASKKNALEESLVTFLKKSEVPIHDEDKSFLDSLLPTLRNFNQDQKLQFRIEVLNLMVKIKNFSSAQPAAMVTQPYPSNNYYQRSTSSASSAFTPRPMISPGTSYDIISSPPSNSSTSSQLPDQFIYNPEYTELP
ncbi:unnamed protein product [Ceutorhynchus assimilis]|uniref:MADF domain-containing protein n=1 Tax=Ceutorhynchus assimilis TaxID=467358 RepID=A0A9N9MJC1_9CUCU|nr:unnamed protein product [Ceutorhynchus assimilis]CAG9765939.1 unnamed protein product [Ceutorhynchus assimilis]